MMVVLNILHVRIETMSLLITESESNVTHLRSSVLHFDKKKPCFSSHMMTDEILVHGFMLSLTDDLNSKGNKIRILLTENLTPLQSAYQLL